MHQRLNVVSEPAPAGEPGLQPSRPKADTSRTVPRRCLAGIVPSLFALLSMSALTVFTIVLVVTTVADTGLRIQGGDWNGGAGIWSRWASSPACSFWDNPTTYASLMSSTNAMEAERDLLLLQTETRTDYPVIALRVSDE